MAVFVLLGTAWAGAQEAPQSSQQQVTGSAHESGSGPATSPSPAAASPLENGTSNRDAPSTDRRKQIADESAILLKMATDLKTEVDKTTKDTLSLSVIRKAGQIEKLAHNVKEQMTTAARQN
jgi:NAD(P)H-dependent flavin oxidoreductase YrpB (nitropropane dioxygenase family)